MRLSSNVVVLIAAALAVNACSQKETDHAGSTLGEERSVGSAGESEPFAAPAEAPTLGPASGGAYDDGKSYGGLGGAGKGKGARGAAPSGNSWAPTDPAAAGPRALEQQPPLSANARYATTYRPGRGHVAAFDAAVARGLLPAVYKDLVGDFAGRYAGPVPAPTDKALAVSFESETSALSGEGQTTGVRVSLRGHDVAPARAPLAVYLVMDTSGSMAGAAIDNARKAAESVVKRLQDTDTFALVTFSSEANLLVGSGPIGPRRQEVLARIKGVEANGGTNISAGLDLAYGEARHAQAAPGGGDAVSVALLLSDGQATAGDTNAEALAARSSTAFQDGIQTSAFGVGTQFDAPLMSTVADRGAGGYYFLADSSQIAKALATELDARLRPVATAVELRVRLADGVVPTKVYGSKQLSNVESMAVRAQEVAIDQREAAKKDIAQNRQEDTQSGMRFFLPAFAAGDQHATLLEVRVPKMADPAKTERPIGVLEVRYKDRKSNHNEMYEIPLMVKQGGAVAPVANKSVQSALLAYSAGNDLLRAAELAQSGQASLAASLLSEQQRSLESAAARLGVPTLKEDAARLGRLAAIVGDRAAASKPMALAVLLRGSGYGYLQ